MIKFGTDGWRALIARDFTFENVRKAALATAKYIKELNPDNPTAVLGYDTRFLSGDFAAESALVLASQGIKAFLADNISSTPQVSFCTKFKNADLGVVITASHNPPQYNGFKIKAGFGGPGTPEQIAKVESYLKEIENKMPELKLKTLDEYISDGIIEMFDAKKPYLEHIRKKINLDMINKAGFKILYDPMFGAGIDTLKELIPDAVEIHDHHNPAFPEIGHPEPIGSHLEQAMEKIRKEGFTVGLATDGDADRLGAIDEDGNFVDSHKVFMILMKYLYEKKGERGSVVKTVSLTSMVARYCEKNDIKLHETPVGFKYTADLMTQENVLIGGEESGGLGTSVHIPERDGIFNGLLLLEAMASEGKSLKEMCNDLDKEFGPHRYDRRDIRVTPEKKEQVLAAAAKQPQEIGGFKVKEYNGRDGHKFIFDNAWLLIRASGTEPLLRFYAEAPTMDEVNKLLDAALQMD